FVAKVREASLIAEPDASTSKGRDEIRKAAAKVTRTKTMLDQARKDLTAEYRKKTADINEAGKVVVEQLDALADEVRQPLTAWEEAEKEREQRCTEILTWLQNASTVTIGETSAAIRQRGKDVFNTQITKEQFGKRYDEAVLLKDTATKALLAALDTAIQREDEQAELQRLREEAAARAERDRIEREAREAEERRAAEARAEEERRAAAEKAEAERIERARQQAAEEAARQVAEAKQREIDEANRRAAEAERAAEEERRAAEAERQRIAAEQAEAERVAAAERAEQERRERSRKHRQVVMTRIKEAIMAAGPVDEAQATSIVKALVVGAVPHTAVAF
ncbi:MULTISPECIES: hypothetical protein, partial [unclassified Novosphingobium]|uniref:hypothetical protein n=1 Tax=unclassified Novosphingobium TaxID=2644732 RepID=UPI000D47AD54